MHYWTENVKQIWHLGIAIRERRSYYCSYKWFHLRQTFTKVVALSKRILKCLNTSSHGWCRLQFSYLNCAWGLPAWISRDGCACQLIPSRGDVPEPTRAFLRAGEAGQNADLPALPGPLGSQPHFSGASHWVGSAYQIFFSLSSIKKGLGKYF